MPSKSLRFCKHPGCHNLTADTYCKDHAELHKDDNKIMRNYGKDKTSKRGYDWQWQKARKAYLNQHPLCERCLEQDIVRPATLIHHRQPIDKGGERLDPNNFMSLCFDCHEIIHGRKRE